MFRADANIIRVKSTILIDCNNHYWFSPLPELWDFQNPGWYSLWATAVCSQCRDKSRNFWLWPARSLTGALVSAYIRAGIPQIWRSRRENPGKKKKKKKGASSPFQQTKQQCHTEITTAATSTTTRSTAAANDRAGWQLRPVEQPRKSIYDGR